MIEKRTSALPLMFDSPRVIDRTSSTLFLLLVVGVLVTGVGDARPRAASTAPTQGLVGYWNFDEAGGSTVLDASGNNNTGSLSGSGVTRTGGKVGSGSLNFDGISGKVTIPHTASLSLTSSFTLTAWLRPTAAGAYQTALDKGNSSACAYWIQTTGTRVSSGFATSSTCSGFKEHVSWNTSLQTNSWSHVAAVFDNVANSFELYVNGSLVYSASELSTPIATTEAIVLGQSTYAAGGYERWRGQLDELRIYNRALDITEVLDVFNDAGSGPATDTQPPTTPSGVSAAPVSSTQVAISWAPSSDNVGVAGYRVYRNGSFVGASVTTNYADAGLTSGTSYSYRVAAYDYSLNLSNLSSSAWATTYGSSSQTDLTPPSVSVTAPSPNATVGASITVIASASDDVGVAGVQFLLDGLILGAEDTSAPYALTWDSTQTADGPHQLAATARDRAGHVTVSSPVTITVDNRVPSSGLPVYPLRLSGDGRSLVDQAARPFFINGDTAWSLIAQLTREQVDVYLSDRAEKGFNAVLVNLIEHEFASRAPRNIYNDPPFSQNDAFASPNEAYFAHADWVINKAAEKGIVVLLAPLYLGYGCGGQGWCAEVRASSYATLREWGRYVGKRYKSFPNIVWVVGGDTDPVADGVDGRLREFVAGLKELDTTHLITAHNAPEQSARAVWANESWLKLNNVYTYQSSAPKASTEYNRNPFMPVFLIESAYENEHGSSPASLRNQAYTAILSGATLGHVFGNCPIWGFGATAEFCSSSNWQFQLNSTGSRTVAYAGKLFTSRAFGQLQPDYSHSVMTSGYQWGSTYASTARTADGNTVIAYLPTRRTVTFNLTQVSGSTARAWWFNPSTAGTTLIGDFPTTGSRTFTPSVDGDWVLVIDNADLGLPAPGAN